MHFPTAKTFFIPFLQLCTKFMEPSERISLIKCMKFQAKYHCTALTEPSTLEDIIYLLQSQPIQSVRFPAMWWLLGMIGSN